MHFGTECLFPEVKSIYILHLENLFQGILHHVFSFISLEQRDHYHLKYFRN